MSPIFTPSHGNFKQTTVLWKKKFNFIDQKKGFWCNLSTHFYASQEVRFHELAFTTQLCFMCVHGSRFVIITVLLF